MMSLRASALTSSILSGMAILGIKNEKEIKKRKTIFQIVFLPCLCREEVDDLPRVCGVPVHDLPLRGGGLASPVEGKGGEAGDAGRSHRGKQMQRFELCSLTLRQKIRSSTFRRSSWTFYYRGFTFCKRRGAHAQ